MRKILGLLLCCFLFACSDTYEEQDIYNLILAADPEKDAIVAARSGDQTLLALSGMFAHETSTGNGDFAKIHKKLNI